MLYQEPICEQTWYTINKIEQNHKKRKMHLLHLKCCLFVNAQSVYSRYRDDTHTVIHNLYNSKLISKFVYKLTHLKNK